MTTPQTKQIQWSEVAKHSTEEDCWIVVENQVIDATKYLNDHPGGPLVITKRAGKDATKKFKESSHSEQAQNKLKTFQVGVIAEGSVPDPSQLDNQGNSAQNLVGIVFLGVLIAFLVYHFVLNE